MYCLFLVVKCLESIIYYKNTLAIAIIKPYFNFNVDLFLPMVDLDKEKAPTEYVSAFIIYGCMGYLMLNSLISR
jgi:hypothetical protein